MIICGAQRPAAVPAKPVKPAEEPDYAAGTGKPAFLRDIDRAQTEELLTLLAQTEAHYGSLTDEACNDVTTKFSITREQLQETIVWSTNCDLKQQPSVPAKKAPAKKAPAKKAPAKKAPGAGAKVR